MEIDKNGSQITVFPTGKIDTLHAGEFERALAPYTEGAFDLVIDFNATTYISSAGLRVLLITAKKAQQQQAKLQLKNLQDDLREVLDITGFTPLFTIV
ncbi:STAS domain-containing protein [Flavobacterium sp. JP2137]|uniref:STAS domain-containing protein n=1 Tax=Flavobacterium sp. JP2137 TaxID=3414510 RepID=UPI003D2FB734